MSEYSCLEVAHLVVSSFFLYDISYIYKNLENKISKTKDFFCYNFLKLFFILKNNKKTRKTLRIGLILSLLLFLTKNYTKFR